jgi:hypothetical protein
LGIDPDKLIPPAQQLDRPTDYDLWPEHWMVWEVYLGCRTQWRKSVVTVGMGRQMLIWDGLDYGAVEVVMNRYEVPQEQRSEVFAQLQVLEQETLVIRNRSD